MFQTVKIIFLFFNFHTRKDYLSEDKSKYRNFHLAHKKVFIIPPKTPYYRKQKTDEKKLSYLHKLATLKHLQISERVWCEEYK